MSPALRACMATLAMMLSAIVGAPAAAQPAQGERENRTFVQPYIEVSQVLTAELTPGDNVLTFTQVATGVDTIVQGSNSAASLSVRYERNFGYGEAVDSDAISGVARGSVGVVPRALTLEAGALASRARIDGGGGVTTNPLVAEDQTSEIFSLYAGPTLATRAGILDITGSAFVGYNRIEVSDSLLSEEGEPLDAFDESVTYAGQIRLATRPGDGLPVGIGVGAGGFQEDVDTLDQRVRDVYLRGDVTVPITENAAIVGGIGYEDVEVSSRDALRDGDGNPLIGDDGRFITDAESPRLIAYDVDGLIWDVGVIWNPSRRTALSATVGRRYASTTYFGNFTYTPDSRSAFAINVYDGLTGFGGALTNSLSGLGADFSATRNALTGDLSGLVVGEDGASELGTLGSTRSTAFRGRGGSVSYQRTPGRTNAALVAGYDRRTFIGAEGTVFEPIDGQRDESYYVLGSLGRDLGRGGFLSANAYVNWFTSETDAADLTAYGASVAYDRALSSRLSARAAVAVDYFDSEFSDSDFAAASVLVGLRLNL
ncbi:MAG: preprotein translocase subunit YajC [Erythrobacter sp.]|uniref:preprotein translocase subunit YajC n=1 Tax=Erythrobacter sp. TaxID=1042 RepID=UPI00261F1A7C|nr:preprotein translocase subunit YajC [Erythrobacter sp.]MDJ0977853.1 preprotein translocase subunit YajC [Erythrobacter sp.]